MPEELHHFFIHHHVQKFKKNEIVIEQGSKPQKVFVVRQGVVYSKMSLADGQTQSIGFNVKGDLFPLSWTFRASKKSSYQYVALTDCELYTMSRRSLHKYLTDNPEQTQKMLRYFAKRYDQYQRQVIALSQQKAADKLAHFFYILSRQFGTNGLSKNLTHIAVPLTQSMLGDLTGLSRETIAKSLQILKTTKAVQYDRQDFFVDKRRLEKILKNKNS